MLIILIPVILAQDYSLIPPTGTPPERVVYPSSVYDPLTNEILTFGGVSPQLIIYSSVLSAFSLTTKTWRILKPQSILVPPGLTYSRIFLTPDRRILVFFGQQSLIISSEVYSYNLNTDCWTVELLKGDDISGMLDYAFTSFTYNNTVFIAFFGGVTKSGVTNNLYFMNSTSRVVRKIVNKGVVPDTKTASSIVYYNECLILYGLSWPDGVNDAEVFVFNLKNETWSIMNTTGVKPTARFNHFAYIYKDAMYVLYGTTKSMTLHDIWLLNLTTASWQFVSFQLSDFRALSGNIQIDNRAYLVLGRNEFEIFNSIDAYDFDGTSVKKIKITNNWNSPPARSNHCSLTISDKIYIFGGKGESGKYLNDIWSYDTTLNVWNEVQAFGVPPSQKESFSCARGIGSTFAVFGGRDDVNIYDEFHYFDLISGSWFKLNPKGERPKERYKTCMCVNGFFVFIVGGLNSQRTFDDLWVYDYVKNRFTEITAKEKLSFSLHDHKCWITSNNTEYSLYIVGGRNASFLHNPEFYKLSLTSSSSAFTLIETKLIVSSSILGISQTELIVSGDYAYLIFGLRDSFIIPLITCINYKTLQITYAMYPDTIATFSHSSAHYRDTFYIFGGISGVNMIQILAIPSNRFLKVSKSENSMLFIPCSAGTISPDCQPCTQGFTYINGECKPCPAGRYSVSIAAVGISECLPCQYGYYSPTPGTTFCYQCPSTAYCPVGASKQYSMANIQKYQNNQPSAYTADTSVLSMVTTTLWYTIIIIGSFAAILVISSKNIFLKIQNIDIFVGQHEQKLNQPVIFRRTSIGGLFSLVFILVAIAILIINLLTLEFDNIVETRSLVPIATIDRSVNAEILELSVIYDLYGGSCADGYKCLSFTEIDESGFDFTEKVMKCELISENCLVQVKYYGFSIRASTKISISMTEITSYSTGLAVNISVSSSVPNKNSNVFIPLYPDSKEKLFRGQDPTIIKYEVNPTVIFMKVFHSEKGEILTGYHITNTETKSGSTVTALTVLTTAFVLLEVNIDIANTGFVIERQLSIGWFILLGNTLGSVFGIFGTLATIMNFIEKFFNNLKEKMSNFTLREMLNERRKNMKNLFHNYSNAKSVLKVYPLDITCGNDEELKE